METLLNYFERVGDGAWRCIERVEFMGPTGRIQVNAGSRFTIGHNYMGLDLALVLEKATRWRGTTSMS